MYRASVKDGEGKGTQAATGENGSAGGDETTVFSSEGST